MQPDTPTNPGRAHWARRWWERLVSPADSLRELGARKKARLLAALLVFTIFAFACADAVFVLTKPGYVPPWFGYATLLTVYGLSRSRQHVWGAAMFALMFPLVAVILVVTGGAVESLVTLGFLVCGPMLGTIFLATPGIIALTAFNIAALLALPTLAPNVGLSTPQFVGLIVINGIVGGLSILHIHHRDTLEREREAALREAESRLRQAQRLEALGRLAAGVAHDFNNLLLVIRGNAELQELERTSEETRSILHAVASGEALVRRLLTAGRQASMRLELGDGNAITRSALEMIRKLLGERFELRLELELALWPVRLDAQQVEQALLNLATNARDAMPNGGRLTLRTHNRKLSDKDLDEVGHARPGEWVAIEVEDDGQGMSEDVRRRVLEPFFTTKPTGKGTGLGLAMVHGMVTQSGGFVRVRSQVGRGTSVELLFPRA
jgi:signal transduction histidine kinase